MNDQIQIGFYSKPLISDIEYEIYILLLPFLGENYAVLGEDYAVH